MTWKPASTKDVAKIVQDHLPRCDEEQVEAFKRYAVEPYLASILRYGRLESLVVVARNRNEAIYWEDVEEGFNMSPITANARILEHWCNQDELGISLNAWVEGRGRTARLAPFK